MAPPIKPPPRPGAPPPEAPDDKGRHATDELAAACGALETEVEELKVKYEMYFLGVERSEPNRTRDELKKKVARLKERFTRNAGIRFRVQSLHARFISYERLWLRNARQKEEGTYRRDIFKARLRAQERGPEVKGKKEVLRFSQAEDVDLSDFGDEPAPVAPAPAEGRPAATTPAVPRPPAPAPAPASTPPRPAAPAPPAPRPAAAAGAPAVDAQARALYEAYVAARKKCNQDVAGITPDAIARTIASQTPAILKQHKASRVEFKVEVKDGKAILKAVPKA